MVIYWSDGSIESMFYVVGLGNPGEKYQYTRHNIGWLVLDTWLETAGMPHLHESAKYAGRVSEGFLVDSDVTVLYPDTFMNKSGVAVRKLVPKESSEKLIVVYDDIDIPLGEIKVSAGKGAGGHNGVRSIIDALGSKDFIRIRVGICPRSFWTGTPHRPTGAKLPKYVLAPFTKRELATVAEVGSVVGEVIKTIVQDGVEAAMNQYN